MKRERARIIKKNILLSHKNGAEMGPIKKMKLKPLLPTLREKKRYLAFEVLTQEDLEWKDIRQAIDYACAEHLGRIGLAQAGILFVKHNKNKGVLRVAHTMLTEVRQALLFITKIGEKQVIVRSLTASGMLAKATVAINAK
jgi:ribonuclease P/MRP protein subunit POP5